MNFKPLIAEFVATFTLVFIGVGAIAMDFITNGQVGLTGIAIAHGLAIAVMVGAIGAISGGHINPAITIGFLTIGKIDLKTAAGYVVSQCLGAIFAAFLIKQCIPAEALTAVKMGTPAVSNLASVTISMALITEIILTFILMFVIYGTAVDKRAPKFGGLFIGLAVALDILMGGPISGAAMNPARHLGPALLGGGLENTWIYWVGPIIGSVLAAMLYHHILAEKDT